LGMLLFTLVMFIHSGLAATVDGHAYKDGATDHSGITINLDALPPIPTIGGLGLIFLLSGISLFLFRNRRQKVFVPMLICIALGLSCITYAVYFATSVTNTVGEYGFTSVDPGGYSIDASAPGYYPAHISSFTVIDGANTAPDLTLYPIPTLTPTINLTSTPTETPTVTPTETPTNTPTPIPTSTPTATPTNTPIPGGYLISTDNIVGNMRYVPGGTFTQGSAGSEPCRNSTETQFSHILTQNIAVMQTEVTRQMWADLKAAQPSLPMDPTNSGFGSGMNNPVQTVSWYEVVLFSNLLSLENGLMCVYYLDSGYTIQLDATNYTTGPVYVNSGANGYRLATEGEWEYFCRAGTTGPFSCPEDNYTSGTCSSCAASDWQSPTSNEELWDHAVFCANNSGISESVCSKHLNPWNLSDVHGNVWEWCWDWHGTLPSGSVTDYVGVATGTRLVVRGGSWENDAEECRSANRIHFLPNYGHYIIGFRLVRVVL